MYAETLPYRERIQELRQTLVHSGSLGLLLIDASELAQVEHDYGSKAFEKVLSMATELVLELRGIEIRNNDLVTISDKGGNAFLVFLSPKRGDREGKTRISDLQAASSRVEEHLNRKLARLTSPYLRGRHQVTVGFSIVFFNPLIMPERLISRLVEEAWECVRIQTMQRAFQNRCRLQEILMAEEITTRFQPVVDLQRGGSSRLRGAFARPRGHRQPQPLEPLRGRGGDRSRVRARPPLSSPRPAVGEGPA